MTATTKTQELQGEVLKTVRKSQEFVVDAIQAWADAVQAIKPPLPDVNIPFTDKLPQPGDFVAGAYDFMEQLLASQRKFAEGLRAKGMHVSQWYLPAHWFLAGNEEELPGVEQLAREVFQFWVDESTTTEAIRHGIDAVREQVSALGRDQ